MRLLLRWILLAVSVIAASYLTKALGLGFEATADGLGSFLRLMLGVAILALLNATLGNILKLLTLPLTCLTLGLFSLVINAVILIWAASLNLGFTITETDGWQRFWTAFVAAVLISAVNGLLGALLIKDREAE
ncbi:MAG: phage holin family protein [Fimbriimonadaceae bacterium]